MGLLRREDVISCRGAGGGAADYAKAFIIRLELMKFCATLREDRSFESSAKGMHGM